MKTLHLILLGGLCGATISLQAQLTPAVIMVSISAAGGLAYELTAASAVKPGRLPQQPGLATTTDSLRLADAGKSAQIGLRFLDGSGQVSACPAVEVAMHAGGPVCEPHFILTAERFAGRAFVCEASCETPRPR